MEKRSLVRHAAVAFDRVRGDALPRDASRDLILEVAESSGNPRARAGVSPAIAATAAATASEVGAVWNKSSYSRNGGGDCVEVARDLPRTVAVRDSKDPHGALLAIEPAEWRDFIAEVKAGRHDLA